MKIQINKLFYVFVILNVFTFNVALLSKPPSELDKYLKKLEEKEKDADKNTKNNNSTKRSDPDLCEKYPNLSICTRFIINPDNESLEKQK